MVPREDMTNAIALNSTMFNSAAAIGPAIAGLAYAALGPGWCFTLNGASFIAIIISLLLMKLEPVVSIASKGSALADIKAAMGFVLHHRVVRTVILNLAVVSLFGFSFVTLIPAWAVDVLGGDAATNGFLQSARGLGALSGGLMLATIGGFTARGKLLSMGSLVLPLLLLFFAGVRWLPLSLLALAGIGWGFLMFANSSNALIQTLVPDELRGRVMSIFTLSFFGLMPVGSLLAGGAAVLLGEPLTVAIGALVTLGFAIRIWLRVPEVRAAT
jgi:MFS family permease